MDTLLWILVGVMIMVMLVMLLRKKSGAVAEGINQTATPEFAQQASGKLDEQSHREVYALIAQGKAREAITAYQNATGCTLFEATTAVTALSKHPQQRPGTF